MVPSLKFTLVAWMAIIGLGSLSVFFKDNKANPRSHPSNTSKGLTCIKPFKADAFRNYPPTDKLITGMQQESKNMPVYLMTGSKNDHHFAD